MKSAIAKEVKEEILGKVKAGEKVSLLSQQYGISNRTVYAWLQKKAEGVVSLLEYSKIKKENQILKEIIGVLTYELEKVKKRPELRKVIQEKIPQATKSLISRLLGLCRSGFYKPQDKLKRRDEILKEQILEVLSVNPGYGHRRIALSLGLGKRRVRRVMKLYGIKPYKRKARWVKKRDLGRLETVYPNTIKGTCPIKSGSTLVGDFTYIPYQGKSVYLATFMDLFTREVVGWNLSTRHTQGLVTNAFIDAIKTLGKIPRVVHSDQGSEYQSKDYTLLMERLGVKISMSRKKSPWENGYQESFYNNFKTDLGLEFERFNSLGELIEAIHQTINYYNKEQQRKDPPDLENAAGEVQTNTFLSVECLYPKLYT